MAADPFNSKGGYSIGIPPTTIIAANGDITANSATFGGNVTITGDGLFTGNVFADVFNGTFNGNISGNLVVPGESTWVVFNDEGNANSNPGFRFDKATEEVTIEGTAVINNLTMGTGENQFSTSSVYFATTQSTSPGQILYTVEANTISAVDFTVIATDPVGNNRQISKLFAGVLGTEVGYYEIATIDIPYDGPGVGNISVAYSAGNVDLLVQPITAESVVYKIMVTSYKE